MSSLLTPDPRMLACFPGFVDYGRVIEEIPIETRTLDSIQEIAAMDFLKIDVQGAELSVFRGGSARLAQAVVIKPKCHSSRCTVTSRCSAISIWRCARTASCRICFSISASG